MTVYCNDGIFKKGCFYERNDPFQSTIKEFGLINNNHMPKVSEYIIEESVKVNYTQITFDYFN